MYAGRTSSERAALLCLTGLICNFSKLAGIVLYIVTHEAARQASVSGHMLAGVAGTADRTKGQLFSAALPSSASHSLSTASHA